MNECFITICEDYVKTRGVKQCIASEFYTQHVYDAGRIDVDLDTGKIYVVFYDKDSASRSSSLPDITYTLISDQYDHQSMIEKMYGKYRYDPIRYGATEHIMEADRFYRLRERWWIRQ